MQHLYCHKAVRQPSIVCFPFHLTANYALINLKISYEKTLGQFVEYAVGAVGDLLLKLVCMYMH